MQAPKILLFKGRGMVSRMIRWQTNGEYSHVAIQRPDGRIVEAWHKPAKVRLRSRLDDWEGVECYELVGIDPEKLDDALVWLNAQIGKKYDFGGVLRFLSRRRKQKDDKWFCSELGFEFAKRCGVDLLQNITLAQVSPTVMAFSPLLIRSVPIK
jgi:uncharacterized protein YycO